MLQSSIEVGPRLAATVLHAPNLHCVNVAFMFVTSILSGKKKQDTKRILKSFAQCKIRYSRYEITTRLYPIYVDGFRIISSISISSWNSNYNGIFQSMHVHIYWLYCKPGVILRSNGYTVILYWMRCV